MFLAPPTKNILFCQLILVHFSWYLIFQVFFNPSNKNQIINRKVPFLLVSAMDFSASIVHRHICMSMFVREREREKENGWINKSIADILSEIFSVL